jgi:hypothetical protein
MYSSRGSSPFTKASAPALFSAWTCARFVPSRNKVEIGKSRSRSDAFSAFTASFSSSFSDRSDLVMYSAGAFGVKEGVCKGVSSEDIEDRDSRGGGTALDLDILGRLVI